MRALLYSACWDAEKPGVWTDILIGVGAFWEYDTSLFLRQNILGGALSMLPGRSHAFHYHAEVACSAGRRSVCQRMYSDPFVIAF
jgi:hypothetical protein